MLPTIKAVAPDSARTGRYSPYGLLALSSSSLEPSGQLTLLIRLYSSLWLPKETTVPFGCSNPSILISLHPTSSLHYLFLPQVSMGNTYSASNPPRLLHWPSRLQSHIYSPPPSRRQNTSRHLSPKTCCISAIASYRTSRPAGESTPSALCSLAPVSTFSSSLS